MHGLTRKNQRFHGCREGWSIGNYRPGCRASRGLLGGMRTTGLMLGPRARPSAAPLRGLRYVLLLRSRGEIAEPDLFTNPYAAIASI